MFTTYNTDICSYSSSRGLENRDERKPFQIELPKNEYTLQQAKIYAIKNDYPIIVETKRGNLWYLKGYGCDRKKLQELINHQIKQKYRPESNLYFINK
jgi:hypothetical protein